jgi:arsenite/tail-anchored protein-transporting ATPase
MTVMFKDLPKFAFFTGKGGVGKTSLACATALELAERGRKVLLVSTDPASNVGQVFETGIGNHITAIAQVAGLDAIEIDPEEAAAQYRDRIVGPMRGVLPDKALKGIEEQLSGACTTEIAAFDEFTALLTDHDLIDRYDHVVFDTAPTGHTIRLLKLPGAWSGFLESGTGDASCLGPLAGLEKQRARYGAAVEQLSDGETTRLILVARPRRSALAEAARTSRELAAIGIKNQHLAINGMMPAGTGGDPLAAALAERDHGPHSRPWTPSSRSFPARPFRCARRISSASKRSGALPPVPPTASLKPMPGPLRRARTCPGLVRSSMRSSGPARGSSCSWARAASARRRWPRPSRPSLRPGDTRCC